MLRCTVVDSPLCPLFLAANDTHLVGLWLEGQKHFGGVHTADFVQDDSHVVFPAVREWLSLYFSGQQPDPAVLPLAPSGTPFQQRVWDALLTLPWGQTVTYGALSCRLGVGSARAVGAAVSRNPISIIIPCHRVVGCGGKLTGYAGGLAAKGWLLSHEARSLT